MPTPGMAAADAFKGHPTPAQSPMASKGVYGILAAGGRKTTVPAQERTKGGAIENHEKDQKPAHARG